MCSPVVLKLSLEDTDLLTDDTDGRRLFLMPVRRMTTPETYGLAYVWPEVRCTILSSGAASYA